MFACLVIPDFQLHAVSRHEPELHARPLALLTDDTRKARICQLNAAAVRAGVAPGMTSTQAKARSGEIVFRVRSAPQEESANEILLECAYGAAAFIESTEPGVCTLDLRGLAVAREEGAVLERWALQIIQRLSGFYLPAQVGFAETPGLAWQAARKAAPFLHIADPQRFWRTLPIDDLSPVPELIEVLRKWGVATAGQFIALGKDRIAERLGTAGLELFETVRSDKIRPLNLTAPKQVYEEFFEFEQPVETLEPLLFILRRFLDQLIRRMELSLLVIQELKVGLLLDSGERHERSIEIPAPNREVEVLFRILHNYLETVRTAAPVKGLHLRARTCASETQQFQLFETAIRDPNHFFETIGRLNALLGPDRVGTPVVEATHRPDDIRLKPITAEKSSRPLMDLKEETIARGLMLRRFRPPLPANVRLRETTPIFVGCSRVTSSISKSAGPWRISGKWWEEDSWNREEWDVQTKDGGLYRLYRDGTAWFVEGAYD